MWATGGLRRNAGDFIALGTELLQSDNPILQSDNTLPSLFKKILDGFITS